MITVLKTLIAILVHIGAPYLGWLMFNKLKQKMRDENVIEPPILELQMILFTYGGLLLVLFTSLFWVWSGMASLGCFYLILGAPIVMAAILFRLNKKKTLSPYHNWIFRLSYLYYIFMPIIFIGIYFLETELYGHKL